MNDQPDVQRADEHATGLLAGHLAGRLAAHVDPRIVAARLVELLRAEGWRPIPRPQLPGQHTGTGTPPPPEWREARDRIRNRTEDPR